MPDNGINISSFDQAVKSAPQNGIDLSAFDGVIKKKAPSNDSSNGSPNASQDGQNNYNQIVQGVFQKYPALYSVGKPEDYLVQDASGQMANILQKHNTGLEFQKKGETDYQYGDDKMTLDNPDKNRIYLNTAMLKPEQVSDAIKLDMVSHGMHGNPQYDAFVADLNNKLVDKYGAKMVANNGGADAYVRGYLSNSPEYQPYKDETRFLPKGYFNTLDKILQTAPQSEQSSNVSATPINLGNIRGVGTFNQAEQSEGLPQTGTTNQKPQESVNPITDWATKAANVVSLLPVVPGSPAVGGQDMIKNILNSVAAVGNNLSELKKSGQEISNGEIVNGTLKALNNGFGALLNTAGAVVPQGIAFNELFDAVKNTAENILPENLTNTLKAISFSNYLRGTDGVIITPNGGQIRIPFVAGNPQAEQDLGELMDNLAMVATFGGVAKGIDGIKGIADKFKNNEPISGDEASKLQSGLQAGVENATVVPQKILNVIPENLPNEQKAAVAPLIEQKQDLEAQKEKVDDAFHPAIDQKIEDLTGEIQAKIFSNVPKETPESKPTTETKTENGVTTELPANFLEPKTEDNAIQEQGAGSVLQREQGEVGETGSERSGMESGQQGNETSETQQPETAEETQPQINSPLNITQNEQDEKAQETETNDVNQPNEGVAKEVTAPSIETDLVKDMNEGKKLGSEFQAEKYGTPNEIYTKLKDAGYNEIDLKDKKYDEIINILDKEINKGFEPILVDKQNNKINKVYDWRRNTAFTDNMPYSVLLRPEENQPKVTAPSTLEGEPAIPPESIGITHEQTENVRQELNLPEYEKNPETVEAWDEEADKRIKAGYDINGLIDRIEKGGQPDHIEQRIMLKYIAGLKDKVNKDPSDANLNELYRAVQASDKGGTVTGKALKARQGEIPVEDTLADFMVREQDNNSGQPLSDDQKQQAEKEFNDISNAKKAYEDKIAQLQEENDKLKAQQEIKKAKSGSVTIKKSHEDYIAERKDIVSSIKDKIAKFKESATKVSAVFDPEQEARKQVEQDKILASIAPDIGKLIKSFVSEGIDKLDDVVKGIHDLLKDNVPNIQPNDVRNLIAGKYNEVKQTKNELSAKVYEIKQQQKLINKLEALQKGEEPKGTKKAAIKSKEITDLQNKIKDFKSEKARQESELKKQVEADAREVKKLQAQLDAEKNKPTPEQAALKSLKTKLSNEIIQLENDLRKGNFKKAESKAPLKLDKEATALKDNLIKLKQEREVRLMKQEYANRSTHQKAIDASLEVLNLPRTLMASMDYSAPLRQGIIASIANPKIAVHAAAEMFKQSISQARFDRWFHDLKRYAAI